MDRLSTDCPDMVAMHPNEIEAAYRQMVIAGQYFVEPSVTVWEWRRLELERWRLAHGEEGGG